jgi:hypothetical protein
MARKPKRPPAQKEITFVTTVPVNIVMKHDGMHWIVDRVWVADEEVDLDPKDVEAFDPDLNPVPMDNLSAIAAFKAAIDEDWPAWEIG